MFNAPPPDGEGNLGEFCWAMGRIKSDLKPYLPAA
jgi:hypothetical protein